MHRDFCDGPHSKVLNNADFGYRRIVIERPLRLHFQVSPEHIQAAEQKLGPAVTSVLSEMNPQTVYRDQAVFDAALATAFKRAGIKFGRTLARRIRELFAEQDDEAEICHDVKGRPLADAELRDHEDVPLDEDVSGWFEREVLPHVPDAWIGGAKAQVGYTIPFTRYFFQQEPVRSLPEIEREIQQVERETQSLLRQLGTA
jgi:type I restriction enzyme M protein